MKMENKKELPKRKPTRLQIFDYSSTGAYFITICTEGRRQILSRIVGVAEDVDPYETDIYGIAICLDIQKILQ